MPNIPCDKRITCPGTDNPVSNFSSEAVDGVDYLGRKWPIWAKPPGPYTPNPGFFYADSCLGVQTAPTQELADLLAALAAQICAFGGDPDGTFDDENPPDTPPSQLYYNAAQTCLWNCADGTQCAHTVPAGYFAAGTQYLADLQAYQYACQQVAANRMCFGTLNSAACSGQVYDEVLTVDKGVGVITPVTFTITAGAIPDGITMSTALPAFLGLSFYGTPTAPGNYSFTIQAVPVFGATITKTFTIEVLGITNCPLPDGLVDTAYSEMLTATGGTAPYTFSADPDAIPTWMTIDPDGTVHGIPDEELLFEFEVTVTDSNGAECIQQCSVNVVASCVPDTGCNRPVSFISCVLPPDLTISDWASRKTELIAPTADPAGVQPEWDGTLPVQDLTSFPGWSYWVPAGSGAYPAWTAFSFNGLLGTLLYMETGNGANPHHLVLRGAVGGVNTTIWEGTRTVEESPIGTFMRTGGLSAGPACFHVTGPVTPRALAWWAMEADPLAVVDQSCGLILDGSFNPAFKSIIVGHVNNALRIRALGVQSPYNSCTGTGMVFSDSGVTIVCWCRVSYPGSDLSNGTSIRYTFYVGAAVHILTVERFEGGNWEASLDGGGVASKGFAAGWHFIVMTYDPISGDVGLDVDQTGMVTVAGASLSPTSNPLTQLQIGTESNSVTGDVLSDFDELAIYNGILTTAQLDCIYNGGTGRTW